MLRQCIAVAALGSHGIIGIRDRDNPRNFRDFCAFESVGIPFAVIAFMVIVCADGEAIGDQQEARCELKMRDDMKL